MQVADKKERDVDFYSKVARKDFLSLPKKVLISFISQLESKLAHNMDPTLPIAHLGDGLIEMKINGSPAFRCVYTMKKPGRVIVVHTFSKTTEGPDVKNVALARKRAKKI